MFGDELSLESFDGQVLSHHVLLTPSTWSEFSPSLPNSANNWPRHQSWTPSLGPSYGQVPIEGIVPSLISIIGLCSRDDPGAFQVPVTIERRQLCSGSKSPRCCAGAKPPPLIGICIGGCPSLKWPALPGPGGFAMSLHMVDFSRRSAQPYSYQCGAAL